MLLIFSIDCLIVTFERLFHPDVSFPWAGPRAVWRGWLQGLSPLCPGAEIPGAPSVEHVSMRDWRAQSLIAGADRVTGLLPGDKSRVTVTQDEVPCPRLAHLSG